MGVSIAVLVILAWVARGIYWAGVTLSAGLFITYAQFIFGFHQANASLILSVIASFVAWQLQRQFTKQ